MERERARKMEEREREESDIRVGILIEAFSIF